MAVFKVKELFFNGLPYNLFQPMLREYESKQRDLERWLETSKSQRFKNYLKQKEVFEYFFALGIFYRYIIAPFTRTKSFYEFIESKGVSSLSIGGIEISTDFRKSIAKADKHFQYILHEYGIDEKFLSLTDVKTIVTTLIQIDERNQNG